MRLLFERVKVVAEPSGATALAALLAGRVDAARRRASGVRSSAAATSTAARFAALTAA